MLFVVGIHAIPPLALERAKSGENGSLVPGGDRLQEAPHCPTMTCEFDERNGRGGDPRAASAPGSAVLRSADWLSTIQKHGMTNQRQVTELLISLRDGNREALNELVPLVYAELRRIARRKLRSERSGHTLGTTALVNEAYLQLVEVDRIQWQSRAHFLAIAAQAMRNILVGHARRRKRVKRGSGAPHVSLSEADDLPAGQADNLPAMEADRILDLDAALLDLAALNPRHARIVECRFFGGMTIEETAAVLEISPATAKRDWTVLRGWLQRELDRER
jgi:RNA polymerase sigma-70 factor, ECF subfamily